jgi:hypothetical protein
VLETEARINLAARLYRHARALARDVADLSVRSETLAAATRHLAGAADEALSGLDASGRLGLADAELRRPATGEAAIVAAQLRQLLADLRPATGGK